MRKVTVFSSAAFAVAFTLHSSVFAQEPAAAAPADPVVARGEYLARLGNCISCHTRPGGEPFAGGVAFHTPYEFLGLLHSSNITPDPETGIGGWTEEDFVRAMHEGKAANGVRLFPAFPYPAFTKVSEEDVRAIYAYLKTVAPVRYTPPANGFAFRMRWGMAIWNALFFDNARFEPDAAQSAEWNRGAYIVQGLGHCGACHTARNVFLAETDDSLAGGSYPDFVEPEKVRTWSAVNLTQAASGLAAWSVEDFEAYLKTGHNSRGGMFGPMNEVIVNSMQHLTAEDAKAMAVYLKSLPPRAEVPQTPLSAAAEEAGESLYEDQCEECHGGAGDGVFLAGPPVGGSAIVQSADPASLINVILYGAEVGKGAPVPDGAWENMRAFATRMTDEEIAAVATYVRGSWNNRGGPVTAAEVAKQR